MPLIFVHGVSVRKGADYEQRVMVRDARFRQIALRPIVPNPEKVTIVNPYWGDLAAKFAWDFVSLPRGRGEGERAPVSIAKSMLEAEETVASLLLAPALLESPPTEEEILLPLARQSLAAAIDVLWEIQASEIESPEEAEQAARLGALAVDYARHHPHPAWLDEVETDSEFIEQLARAIDAWRDLSGSLPMEDLGGSDAVAMPTVESMLVTDAFLGGVFDRFLGFLGGASGLQLAALIRDLFHRRVGHFLGDVFVYLNARGIEARPGPIVMRMLDAFQIAGDAISVDDPKLIVVGHSMGACILYDVLTHYLPVVNPNLKVDVFVSVGSQVAVFEELKLYRVSKLDIPMDPIVDRVPKPDNVERWLNIYDHADLLAFLTQGVFQDTVDLPFSTGESILAAHGSYFASVNFHQALADQLGAP